MFLWPGRLQERRGPLASRPDLPGDGDHTVLPQVWPPVLFEFRRGQDIVSRVAASIRLIREGRSGFLVTPKDFWVPGKSSRLADEIQED